MVNDVGLEEAGIDGGGIFREFLSQLIKTSFDPNRGFFKFVLSIYFKIRVPGANRTFYFVFKTELRQTISYIQIQVLVKLLKIFKNTTISLDEHWAKPYTRIYWWNCH